MDVSPRAGVTQLVECDLAKVDVAGSNPVSRSINRPTGSVHDEASGLTFLRRRFCAVSFAQDYKLESIAAPPRTFRPPSRV